MKGTFQIQNPGEFEVTLELTATLKEWEEFVEGLPDIECPTGSSLDSIIKNIVQMTRRVFSSKSTYQSSS